MPRRGIDSDKALLLKHCDRLADWRPAHPEALRELTLVEPRVLGGAVDIHVGDRFFQRGIDTRLEVGLGSQRLQHKFGSRFTGKRPTRLASPAHIKTPLVRDLMACVMPYFRRCHFSRRTNCPALR